MPKYHISKNGKPSPCYAKKRPCPLEDTPHFDSEKEAFEYIEKTQENNVLPKISYLDDPDSLESYYENEELAKVVLELESLEELEDLKKYFKSENQQVKEIARSFADQFTSEIADIQYERNPERRAELIRNSSPPVRNFIANFIAEKIKKRKHAK